MPRPSRLSRRNAAASGVYRERARLGGIARMAKVSPERLSAIGRHGAAVRLMSQSPERLREIARLGAQATNRKRWGTRSVVASPGSSTSEESNDGGSPSNG